MCGSKAKDPFNCALFSRPTHFLREKPWGRGWSVRFKSNTAREEDLSRLRRSVGRFSKCTCITYVWSGIEKMFLNRLIHGVTDASSACPRAWTPRQLGDYFCVVTQRFAPSNLVLSYAPKTSAWKTYRGEGVDTI